MLVNFNAARLTQVHEAGVAPVRQIKSVLDGDALILAVSKTCHFP
jgi:hypothetical protein